MDRKCYKAIAALLAKYIADNFHHCPIKDNVIVTDCECWNSEKCAECILKNSAHLE